jgi:hypothetical protein
MEFLSYIQVVHTSPSSNEGPWLLLSSACVIGNYGSCYATFVSMVTLEELAGSFQRPALEGAYVISTHFSLVSRETRLQGWLGSATFLRAQGQAVERRALNWLAPSWPCSAMSCLNAGFVCCAALIRAVTSHLLLLFFF